MTTPDFKRTTAANRLTLLACAALAAPLLLSGCTYGSSEPVYSLEAPTVTKLDMKPAVAQKEVVCPTAVAELPSNSDLDYPAEPRGGVPEGFVPAKVFICRGEQIDGNKDLKVTKDELQGDFAPLLAALAVSSERAAADDKLVCEAMLETMPVLWLVNAKGEAIDAALPTSPCRRASAKPDTQKALDGLTVFKSEVVTASAK